MVISIVSININDKIIDFSNNEVIFKTSGPVRQVSFFFIYVGFLFGSDTKV